MNSRRRPAHVLVGGLLAFLTLASPIAMHAGSPSPSSRSEVSNDSFQDRIPLGIVSLFARPVRRTLYVMGTARSAAFRGWRPTQGDRWRPVEHADGTPVTQFPRRLSFRVTASALLPDMPSVDRDLLDGVSDLNALLISLGFRLKIFHGLDVTAVEPDAIEMIGMPADVPYDERVYRIGFILPRPVSIDDRLVLEVLDSNGERLCKFHLEF